MSEYETYVVYGFDDCPFCMRAIGLLRDAGVNYTYHKIATAEDRKSFLDANAFEGRERTFPRIFQGIKLIGGYVDLEEHFLFGEG